MKDAIPCSRLNALERGISGMDYHGLEGELIILNPPPKPSPILNEALLNLVRHSTSISELILSRM